MKDKDLNIFYYKVFGLYFQSEILLEGLIETPPVEKPDVLFQYGNVTLPEEDLPDTVYEQYYIYNESLYFVKVPRDVAVFMVKKEPERTVIFFDLKDKVENQTAMAWFFGLVLSGVLQMNNLFAFHASGVLHQGYLHLFCGHSGMGKSTIATQLRSRGYPLFTDDKCVVQWQEDVKAYLASPGLQVVRLWENSVEQIKPDDFLTDRVPVVFKSRKSQFRIKDSASIREAQTLRCIYILAQVPEGAALKCVPLTGVRKVRFLRKQIFREDMINGFKKEETLWNFLQQLVQKVPVYILRRPKNTPISTFGDFVEQVINERPLAKN